MGLVPFQERMKAEKAIAWAKKTAVNYLHLDHIWNLAHGAEQLEADIPEREAGPELVVAQQRPRIGFIRDRSFWFYYPENLDHLRRLGATMMEIDAFRSQTLPEIDALYIGGGFPEMHAEALAKNRLLRDALHEQIEAGLPVYAECGGLMYLGEHIIMEGKAYPMVGALPLDLILEKKPQGHGYTVLEVCESNPYYPVGTLLKGHEFHYSKALVTREGEAQFVFTVKRGHGLDGRKDGLCKKKLLATYTHVHAAGNPLWAKSFFNAAAAFSEASRENP
jgi:cobyrinic acid a,c-diamide synthase